LYSIYQNGLTKMFQQKRVYIEYFWIFHRMKMESIYYRLHSRSLWIRKHLPIGKQMPNKSKSNKRTAAPMKKKRKPTPAVPLKTCSLGRFTIQPQPTWSHPPHPPATHLVFPHLGPQPTTPWTSSMRLYKHVIE